MTRNTKRHTYRGKYPHRIRTVASGASDRGVVRVTLNDGQRFTLSVDQAKRLGFVDIPPCGAEFPLFSAFEIGVTDRITDDGAILERDPNTDTYTMRGATGMHTLWAAPSGVNRVIHHWISFLDAHRAARATAKRPRIESVRIARINPARNAYADHRDMRELLGLREGAKLPAEGMAPRIVDGVTVYVAPLSADPAERKRRPHRVRVICPLCGADISAGRLHQHRC